MRTLIVVTAFVKGIDADYSSFSSSTFSSSYTNENGVEHSSSAAEESYSEKDSNGMNRHGSGKLRTENGVQVYEETKNCDGGKCVSSTDTGKRRIVKRISHH